MTSFAPPYSIPILHHRHQLWLLNGLLYFTSLYRGFSSIIQDYVPKSLQGLGRLLLYGVTAGTLAGLLYLNYSDVGVCGAVRLIWSM